MGCKCWPQTIPAASQSCANCTSGGTYFWDQSNIPDSNFWTITGDTPASKGSPPMYAVLANTASVGLTSTFTMVNAIVLGFFQYNWRMQMNVQGSVAGANMREVQWGTGVNGHFSIQHSIVSSGGIYSRRINILNDSGGVLYTADTVIGAAPQVGVVATAAIRAVQTDVANRRYDIYVNGVKVVNQYQAAFAGPSRLVLNPGWSDAGNYPVGPNSLNCDNRFGQIYITAASGLPYACCG